MANQEKLKTRKMNNLILTLKEVIIKDKVSEEHFYEVKVL